MQQPNLLNQLLQDESFSQWVHHSYPSAVAYWDDWIARHPEQQVTVTEAARIVQGIPFAPQKLSPEEVQQSWNDLEGQLFTGATGRSLRRRWYYAAALVGLLIGSLAWWTWDMYGADPTYVTSYGELQEYVLPDGSKVTLNAHSRLTYQAYTDPPRREVVLEGEAFFSVVHLDDSQPIPFVVRTRDLAVQVLGTEFNVNTRRGRTQVVLDKGKVALQLPTQETTPMVPGELAEFQAKDNQVYKQAVDTKLFTGWCDRKLIFDDTPLSEVALLLEENYGVKVEFDNPTLRVKPVSGEISARRLDTILSALAKLFSIKIQHSGDTIYIAEYHVTP